MTQWRDPEDASFYDSMSGSSLEVARVEQAFMPASEIICKPGFSLCGDNFKSDDYDLHTKDLMNIPTELPRRGLERSDRNESPEDVCS